MPLVKSNEVDIHYMEAGAGPATLWVHGAGGTAAIWWQQAEHFAKTRRFIAYDQRGYGQSACDMSFVTVDALVPDALAVMDAAKTRSAAVICQSIGGWTGINLALRAPERVERLVLSSTMAGINHPPAIASVMASNDKVDDRGPVSIVIGPDVFAENPFKAYLYQQANAFNTTFDASKLGSFFSADNLVPLEDLEKVTCPVLVISGENDILWPPHTLEAIVEALPDARQVIIKGSGHSPYFERPDVFNGLVEDFLNE